MASESHLRAYEEYVAGATMKQLATKYGVTEQAVSCAFKRAGLPVRPRGRPVRLGTPQHPNNQPLADPLGSDPVPSDPL